MSWFPIVLLASLCWSATNHIEKFLLSKYFIGGGAGGYQIFATLENILFCALIFFFKPETLATPARTALVLIASGAVYTFGMIAYLHALERDEASIVVPIWQTIPVFAFILGFFLLGETLSRWQLIGSVIIVAAAVSLSVDINVEKKRIKKSVLGLMLVASFLIACSWLFFKIGAIGAIDFWVASFWQFIGSLIIGIGLFVCVPKFRAQFFQIFHANTAQFFIIDLTSTLIDSAGNRLMAFALLSVPVALAQVVNGFQPVFVLLIAVFLTLFFPKLGVEKIDRAHITQKIFAIFAMLCGAFIIGV